MILFAYEIWIEIDKKRLIAIERAEKNIKLFYHIWVIPCEISHSKNESLPIVFIRCTQSVHPMRFHNPEYQPPVTSGSRVIGCTNFVK